MRHVHNKLAGKVLSCTGNPRVPPCGLMIEFVQTPQARLVIWLGILAILSVIGIHVVRRFRDSTEQSETSSSMLTKFREMRHRGVLSETEFRDIKTTLADDVQAKVKRKDDSV